jgi:hypothetical protein
VKLAPSDLEQGNDPQLQRAVEVVAGKMQK